MDKRIVFLDGDYVPWDQATVHIMSHSFGRGSAVFEVLSFHETPRGPAIFRLDEHIARLMRSVSAFGMSVSMSAPELDAAVRETVRRNGLTEGYLKIICYFPQVSMQIVPPRADLSVSIFSLGMDPEMTGMKSQAEGGVAMCISRWRKLDPQTVPVEAKAAGNYLNGMAARIDAEKRGYQYAVMLDTQGFVAEGGTESIFLVSGGKLLTPVPGTILNSISRKSILEIAGMMGIVTSEWRLRPDDLLEADEIFLSSTGVRVLPVNRIEDRSYRDVPGAVTRDLNQAMARALTGRDERLASWNFPV